MIFVAEIGVNHDGSFALAKEMVRQAKAAGADIAKFQFGWRCGPGEINVVTPEIAEDLKAWCDYQGIEMMASIITEEALDLARHVGLARYKIASRTVVDKPKLVEKVLAEGKPTYVSLGFWQGDGWPFGAPDGKVLHYVHCVSSYPTMAPELAAMPARFDPLGYFGYSDHFLGTEACLLAISRGARFVEKHVTVNKGSQVVKDHALSATADEFRHLVETGRPLARLVETVGLPGQ